MKLAISILSRIGIPSAQLFEGTSPKYLTDKSLQSKRGGRSCASISRRVSPTGQAENWLSE